MSGEPRDCGEGKREKSESAIWRQTSRQCRHNIFASMTKRERVEHSYFVFAILSACTAWSGHFHLRLRNSLSARLKTVMFWTELVFFCAHQASDQHPWLRLICMIHVRLLNAKYEYETCERAIVRNCTRSLYFFVLSTPLLFFILSFVLTLCSLPAIHITHTHTHTHTLTHSYPTHFL